MKRFGIATLALMMGLGALAPASPARAESALVMLEKGIYAEQTKGDVDAAVKIYQKILDDTQANRKFVAQAQYRLGVCYTKKKQTDKAVAAFKTLIATYGEQEALVALARERLKTLAPPTAGTTSAGGAPVTGAASSAAAMIKPLEELWAEAVSAVIAEDAKKAETLMAKLIASTRRLKASVKVTNARRIVDRGLALLTPIQQALAKNDLKRAKLLLDALEEKGGLLEQAFRAAVENTGLLGYVDDTAESRRSLGGSGHAVVFRRAGKVTGIRIFASRYGMPQAPNEDFHVYLLDAGNKIIADFTYPYSMIARGGMKWYTLKTPPTAVGDKFFVALSFNPHRTKGVYLGLDDSVTKSHSYAGLPGRGFAPLRERQDWMVRVHQAASPASAVSNRTGTIPSTSETLAPLKALTTLIYKAVANGDAKTGEELMGKLIASVRSLRDSLTDTRSRKVVDSGLAMLVPIHAALAKKDLKRAQALLEGLNKAGPLLEEAFKAVTQDTSRSGLLSYVDDSAESKQSLGGSGHAVVFRGPGKVTAIQIFAGRYGTAKAPDEKFHVYLLDADNKTVAEFTYPYSMIARGDMKWYTLATRPTVVGQKYTVALSFNPHRTKGIYLGLDDSVTESHSFTGLPGGRFAPLRKKQDWMVRVQQAPSSATVAPKVNRIEKL